MNALPCAGRLLWDTAGLREFCLQPPLPIRWAFQAWKTDKVELSEHGPLPGAQARATVAPVRAQMAALRSANTASFHQRWALSSGCRGASFDSSFLFSSVCVRQCHYLSYLCDLRQFKQTNGNLKAELWLTLLSGRFCQGNTFYFVALCNQTKG